MKNWPSLVLVFLITAIGVHKYTKSTTAKEIARLEAEVYALKIDMQYNETETYSQCQRFMQINAKIQRVDGCIRAVDILCNERAPDKAEMCMKSFMPVCDRLDQ